MKQTPCLAITRVAPSPADLSWCPAAYQPGGLRGHQLRRASGEGDARCSPQILLRAGSCLGKDDLGLRVTWL